MGRYNDRIKAIGNKRGKRKFLRLFSNVKRSVNYHGLSLKARCLLFELIDRYDGINNGFIGLGAREAAYELRCSHGSIISAMREIDDAGLAYPTKLGSRLGKKATEWRLTFLRCDKTGELPINSWEQRKPLHEVSLGNTKGQPRKHRAPLRSASETQKPNSSMNDPTMRSATETHIDMYQDGVGAAHGENSLEAEVIPLKPESNQRPPSIVDGHTYLGRLTDRARKIEPKTKLTREAKKAERELRRRLGRDQKQA